jgi:hypothetical protein
MCDVAQVSAVSDNAGGNTWAVAQAQQGNMNVTLALSRLTTQVTASNAFSFTLAGAITEFYASALEVTGIATSPLDQSTNHAADFNSAVDCGTTSPTTQADEITIGWVGMDSGPLTLSPGSGYTAAGAVNDAGRSAGFLWKIVSATGVQNPTATAVSGATPTATGWDALVATFKGDTGGAAVATPPPIVVPSVAVMRSSCY